MQSNEIKSRFLKFFETRGHKIIPSASLVPENDPSVLFTTAGMQPLVPYLLGQEHPMGKRIVNIQKCVRTQDIDKVGDNTHDTFFEMMGNWSLGDYFKEEAIKWSYEFLTSKEEGLGLDPKRLYITVFGGNSDAPRDDESIEIWKKYIPENRIYVLSAGEGTDKVPNWWSVGDNGPCGPDTEMFYDITQNGLGNLSKEEYVKADQEQKIVEIWNDVFMEYEKKDGKVIGKLKQRNVDTGAGLERVAMAVQGKDNIFDTDLFAPVIEEINKNTRSNDIKAKRIIADHIRTSVFLISDGVIPSNTRQGYVLRRLLRRAMYYCNSIGLRDKTLMDFIELFIHIYKSAGYNLESRQEEIYTIIQKEAKQFSSTLESGKKQFEKSAKQNKKISAEDAFILSSTYGFPVELTIELAKENKIPVDVDGFSQKMKEHKDLSRISSSGMFKGGLAN